MGDSKNWNEENQEAESNIRRKIIIGERLILENQHYNLSLWLKLEDVLIAHTITSCN